MNRRLLLLQVFYWGTVAVLLAPLGVVVVMSVKAGSIVGFPLGPPSGRWYAAILDDPDILAAFALSGGIAVAATVLSLVVGIWAALALQAVSSRGWRLVLLGGIMAPLVTPGLIHAIALRMAIREIGLDPGPLAIVLGHAIHATPYVAVIVAARLAAMPPSMVAAARTLGASPSQCFRHIVRPWLSPAILAAAILALLTSFDDFVRSFFLGGYRSTLPVLIYGRLHGGFTPEINAISTVVLAFAFGAGLLGALIPKPEDRAWTPSSR